MQIINLTPHTINEVTTGTKIPASGRVVRLKLSTVKSKEIAGMPVFESVVESVEGLPEAQPDTYYLVSAIVLAACPERNDLLSPGNLVRDENGQPTGCVGFRSN